jgi:hypothetical protein
MYQDNSLTGQLQDCVWVSKRIPELLVYCVVPFSGMQGNPQFSGAGLEQLLVNVKFPVPELLAHSQELEVHGVQPPSDQKFQK